MHISKGGGNRQAEKRTVFKQKKNYNYPGYSGHTLKAFSKATLTLFSDKKINWGPHTLYKSFASFNNNNNNNSKNSYNHVLHVKWTKF